MNGHVNHSISRPTPFVETSNEKLKWNTDVNMRPSSYDVYDMHMRYSFHEDVML
jgi:hypothetical protein